MSQPQAREPAEWPEAGRPLGHAKKLKEQTEAILEEGRKTREANERVAGSGKSASASSTGNNNK